MKTVVINFIGGPGTGKSLMAALLFAHMKKDGFNVEYIQEFAKELVWKKEFDLLKDQLMVAKKQSSFISLISKSVKVIITDGPIFHNIYYGKYVHFSENMKEIVDLVIEDQKKYNNINIFLKRNLENGYEESGRMQTESQAISIDPILISLLESYNINYNEFLSDFYKIEDILSFVKKEIVKFG